MRHSRSAILLGALGSALGSALAPTTGLLELEPRRATGRRSTVRKLRNWWAPVHTTSRQARNPNDPRQAALISAAKAKAKAKAKRERRATKLAKAALSYR